MEIVKILKNKKTGNYHCPFCFKKLKEIKKPSALECKTCKKYYGNPEKMKNKKGFFEKKLKINVLYRGHWYYASSVMIDDEGILDIEYCHGVEGSLDFEHIDNIIIEEDSA